MSGSHDSVYSEDFLFYLLLVQDFSPQTQKRRNYMLRISKLNVIIAYLFFIGDIFFGAE